MALTTKIDLSLSTVLTNDLDFGDPSSTINYQKIISLATGTGANQADMVFSDQRTLAASATEDLDLAGVLTNAFGATMTFARVKAIIVAAAAGNTNVVQVTRPASNGVPLFIAAGDGISIYPGGIFAVALAGATGYLVTAGTGDLITFTNGSGGTSVTYDVFIIGASA